MDLNNNNDNELDDVNVDSLAIADSNANNQVGAGNNVAETLVVPEDPMADFFNESGLTRAVVLFAGVQGAGKIRRLSKTSWDMFGGDWNKLLSVAYPHLIQTLGLGALEAGPAKDYLKRLTTNVLLEARPPPKSLSNYRFEVRVKVFGEEYLSFVPGTFHKIEGLSIPLPDALSSLLVEKTPDAESVIPVDIVVRAFDMTTKKFALLAKETTMRVVGKVEKDPFLRAETQVAVIQNFCFDVEDPEIDTWVGAFWTEAFIHYYDGKPFLAAVFKSDEGSDVVHPTFLLDLMEKLYWM